MTNKECLQLKEIIEANYFRSVCKFLFVLTLGITTSLLSLLLIKNEVEFPLKGISLEVVLGTIVVPILIICLYTLSKAIKAMNLRQKQYEAMKDFKPETSLENLEIYSEFEMLYKNST